MIIAVGASVAMFAGACGSGTGEEPTVVDAEAVREQQAPEEDFGNSEATETLKAWSKVLSDPDPSAYEYVLPGSTAYLYTEGLVEMPDGSTSFTETAVSVDAKALEVTFRNELNSMPAEMEAELGVDRAEFEENNGDIVLSDFEFNEDGKITDFTRQGQRLSEVLVPGDGQVHQAQGLNLTVSSFRVWDGAVSMMMRVENPDYTSYLVTAEKYVDGNGQQHDEDAWMMNEIFPGASTMWHAYFQDAAPGGTIYLSVLNDDSFDFTDLEIPVPQFS